ncbi:MAG: SgcJ/EcaC family oxidoreductase [Bryobacteraceae bacterium]|nr:SgcJ/EcaC family oxidoreductase [Bryobacteraceae bacterium]
MLPRRLLLLFSPLLVRGADDAADIQAMLLRSVEDWNRGDLAAFSSYYEDSPETTFVGKDVVRGGPAAILARYQRAYPGREAMGTLAFSEIHVRRLGAGLAQATGRYHLKRTQAGGGDASGRYTLVVRKSGRGDWKIIHDHSSAI